MERCPSFAFFSGLGPTMKDAVTTNLHLKCCPARPPAYAALRTLLRKGARAAYLAALRALDANENDVMSLLEFARS
jgi:hypothetical protein